MAALQSFGVESWVGLVEFLTSYDELEIVDGAGKRCLWFHAVRAARGADRDWVVAYQDALGAHLAPVGGYSHMLISLGDDGLFYGSFDAEFGPLGAAADEVVDAILCRRPPSPLTRRLS